MSKVYEVKKVLSHGREPKLYSTLEKAKAALEYETVGCDHRPVWEEWPDEGFFKLVLRNRLSLWSEEVAGYIYEREVL